MLIDDMAHRLQLATQIRRKSNALPRFVVVPHEIVEPWGLTKTTVLEVTINAVSIGRRSLIPWGKGETWWFISLPEAICKKARIETGEDVDVLLARASDALPRELLALIESNAEARKAWGGLSSSAQRMLREHVASAKQPDTRTRRARKKLLGA